MIVRNVAVFFNPARGICQKGFKNLERALIQQKIKYYILDYANPKVEKGTDIVISLGGDGSLLKAVRAASTKKIKVLGVNLGNLGFLTFTNETENFIPLLNCLKTNNFCEQKRSLIEVNVIRKHKNIFKGLALNECVVKATQPRVLRLNTFYAKSELKKYFADGLLLSTPTGSTAYNLAAGGPILQPHLDVFTVTPICAHTLAQRPLVLTLNKPFSIVPLDSAVLCLDGQSFINLQKDDTIKITQSHLKANILFASNYDFFKLLSIKLDWGSNCGKINNSYA